MKLINGLSEGDLAVHHSCVVTILKINSDVQGPNVLVVTHEKTPCKFNVWGWNLSPLEEALPVLELQAAVLNETIKLIKSKI